MQPERRTSSRRRAAMLGGLAFLALIVFPAAAQPPLAIDPAKLLTLKTASPLDAKPGPNPYLSFLPDGTTADWAYWNARLALEGRDRRAVSAPPSLAARVDAESEPNDTPGTADVIGNFGTAPGRDDAVDVTGLTTLPPPPPLAALPEDEGAIPLATPTGLTSGNAVRVAGTIGDGPHGSAAAGGGFFTGDFDFFAVTGVKAGSLIVVDVDTPLPFDHLDSFVSLWHSSGALLAFSDDDFDSFDSLLAFRVPVDGDYYVSIGGFGSFITLDPFDPASGFGPGSEGGYEATIGLDYVETDYFTLDLRRGDVFAANLLGVAGTVALIDPQGTVRVGSGQDLSPIYAVGSPLPGGGSAALAYVIEEPGTWRVRLDGASTGAYTLELRTFRSALEQGSPGEVQTLFIDFDGATINAQAIFGTGNNPAVLSPLSSFLADWGLGPADEDAVIDAVLAAVEESVSEDMRTKGLNGDFEKTGIPGEFDVRILNSRDHADPFGQPNVSRLIVGGTIAEIGFSTIGIAESIDVGNFGTGETGVILLDILSGQVPSGLDLNALPRDPGATIVDLIGIAVGNITAHEAGHFLGNFHTEQFVTPPNIQDQGGNLLGTIGVGDDGVFGTADDIDVDFGFDVYAPNEGFVGLEDTLDSIAFGCSTPASATVIVDGCDSGVSNLFLPDDTTINEAIGLCAAGASNHGDFVSCVNQLVNSLVAAGWITGADHGAVNACTAQASIP